MTYRFYVGNDLHYVKISNMAGFLLCTVLGIVMVFFVSKLIAMIPFVSSFFQYFGRNSLIVMTTHLEYMVVEIVPKAVELLLPQSIIQRVVIFAVVLFVEAVICEFVNRTPLRYIFRYPGVNGRASKAK